MSFESTFWTSNDPLPFSPAPGAGGMGGVRRKPATIDFESGFALEELGAEYALPEQVIKAKGPFIVKKTDVLAGQTPAALIQIVFTDRGAVNQTSLNQGIFDAIKSAGFIMSVFTRFYSVDADWAWRKQPAADKYTKDLYFPVVSAQPGTAAAPFDGLVYSGSALSSAQLMDAHFVPTAALLNQLPKQLWVYSFAVTNPNRQFTDADGAAVLTALKTAWSNTFPKMGASAYGFVTLTGANADVFEAEPAVAKKSNTWLWIIGAAIAAGYKHTPAIGAASKALARQLRR